MDYAEPLLQLILNELKSENVDNVLEIFNNYNLNPDFLKEHLVDLQFNPTKVDLFKSVGKFILIRNKNKDKFDKKI